MTELERRGEVRISLLSWVEEPDGYKTTTYEIPGSRTRERFFCELENPAGRLIHTTLVYDCVEAAVDVAATMANVWRRTHPAKVTLWGRVRAMVRSMLASRAIP